MTARPRPARYARSRIPARVRRRWPLSQPSARSQGHRRSRAHRSVYSRSYLPHIDAPYAAQGVTFRLADSVPRSVIDRWREEIALSAVLRTEEARYQELLRRIARYEDAGWGECHLRRPEIATLVCEAIVRFDGQRYRLWEWCVMPNHVHVLLKQFKGFPLGDVVRRWKGATAREANAILGTARPVLDARVPRPANSRRATPEPREGLRPEQPREGRSLRAPGGLALVVRVMGPGFGTPALAGTAAQRLGTPASAGTAARRAAAAHCSSGWWREGLERRLQPAQRPGGPRAVRTPVPRPLGSAVGEGRGSGRSAPSGFAPHRSESTACTTQPGVRKSGCLPTA